MGIEDAPFSNPTTGDWRERPFEEGADAILKSAGNPDMKKLARIAKEAQNIFEECKLGLLATLDAVLAEREDKSLREIRESASKLVSFMAWEEIAKANLPSAVWSRDTLAVSGRVRSPPHISVHARRISIASGSVALEELSKTARQCRLYLQKRMNLKGECMARTEDTVFIGHGRSSAWKDLKEFLKERLGLTPAEFNTESVAGLTTSERLQEMLDSAVFAFLVMTAEDQHADQSTHARENVIHEAGLFQGRLGFRRAIVLLEEGCAEFSNIVGLGQIRFPKGDINAKTEDIRQVLEREGLLKAR